MKKIIISIVAFPFVFVFLLVIVLGGSSNSSAIQNGGLPFPTEVLTHKPMVEFYAEQYGVSEYVNIILAIMTVESGGTGGDPMQSSESAGLPPNTIQNPEESIRQGCFYFSGLVQNAKANGCDDDTIIQSYNYGGGFINYTVSNGGIYSFDNAIEFAKQKSGGATIKYSNPIAKEYNGGWRYKYGNMFYVKLVHQYLFSPAFTDETANIIIQEALKYEGYPYVFGGNPPNAFDCSALTMWCYRQAGMSLPRTAQEQYDCMEHIYNEAEARPGDLVFFTGTYNAGRYITHTGIYVGNGKMYHAGNPIGYADLHSNYFQSHFVCFGRYKN